MSAHSESPKPSTSQTKHHGSARAWTKEETALLDKYCEEYREANETARATIASNVWEEMRNVLDTGKLLNKGDRTAVKKVSNVLSNLLNEVLIDSGYKSLV